ncbi:MAG TPA: sorbosone dehydrogenase family protein [Stellaceae bacterium]|nr:sorbosone dehydrogenase family protein [Stellaceae bacterium]
MRLLKFWPHAARAGSGRLLVAITVMSMFAMRLDAATPVPGGAAFGDWTRDAPGVVHHITPADLPPPYATQSAANGPQIVPRPAGALPKVPHGFAVEVFASGVAGARLLRSAPNGDIFLAETSEGRIVILHDNGRGKRASVNTFASGLDEPFGLAFYPPGGAPRFLYVGTVGAVLRFPYRSGDAKPEGSAETVARLPADGGHRTRDVAFSRDGRKMFVSVGSTSNDGEDGEAAETRRANVLEFDPDSQGRRIFASGTRNPVGLAIDPVTGALWTAVNERDGLGDNLPPDYVTQLRDGGFYGWPWYYIGDHRDPRHNGEHPELARRVLVPDVLIQPHSAPLQLAFYSGNQFPAAYRNNIFVALHGSWNRAQRTGYKVVRVMLRNGKPTGAYQDFLTGFVTANGDVWGRPVGVGVAPDGSLLVSEDANDTVWRVSYLGGS